MPLHAGGGEEDAYPDHTHCQYSEETTAAVSLLPHDDHLLEPPFANVVVFIMGPGNVTGISVEWKPGAHY
jgi:hypothetical protein